MRDIDAYPLSWPVGQKRTSFYSKKSSRFKIPSFAVARDNLMSELKRFSAQDVIVSTNIPLRRDGLPLSGYRQPDDVGVAVYFQTSEWINGNTVKKPFVIACDQYKKIEENLYAIAKTIDALRSIERWGSTEMMQQAFAGFAQIAAPKPRVKRHWTDVLHAGTGMSAEVVGQNRKELLMRHHPDRGGSHELTAEINQAWEDFKKERGL